MKGVVETVLGVAKALVDLVFPPCCAGCGKHLAAGILCELCADQIERITSPKCPRCSIPFDGAGADHLCGECIVKPPPFTSTSAAFNYAGPIADGIKALKYGPRVERAGPLSQMWLQATEQTGNRPEVDVAIPVPLDARRLRERGFNQTVLLAKPLLRAWRLPLDCSSLLKAKGRPTQASLSIEERKKSLRGAFLPLSSRARTRLQDRRVLLLDDVMTTGATARECARVLLEGGAAEVHVAVLARTDRYSG
jgi:ComF family protein